MPTVAVEVAALQALFARREELVQAITTGVASQEWDGVMAAFDALLLSLQRLEAGLEGGRAGQDGRAVPRENLDGGEAGE